MASIPSLPALIGAQASGAASRVGAAIATDTASAQESTRSTDAAADRVELTISTEDNDTAVFADAEGGGGGRSGRHEQPADEPSESVADSPRRPDAGEGPGCRLDLTG
ncbi:MAG: hypothetical protein SF069_17115 [Phycisphaerae bacterium]|nr:hypothetical protein [Phycisphaerae bacterium]